MDAYSSCYLYKFAIISIVVSVCAVCRILCISVNNLLDVHSFNVIYAFRICFILIFARKLACFFYFLKQISIRQIGEEGASN